MNSPAIARLTDCGGALIGALDAGDVVAIEQTVQDFSTALAQVRSAGGWIASPEARAAVRHAMRLADAAAVRTNFLADQSRRRLDAVMRARGAAPRIGYTRAAQGVA